MSTCSIGSSLFAHRGSLAQKRKHPNHEYTRNGLNALERHRIIMRLLMEWVRETQPYMMDRFGAMADYELAQRKAKQSQSNERQR